MSTIGFTSEKVIVTLIEVTRRLIETASDYKDATVKERQVFFTETYTALKTTILSDNQKLENLLKELREAGESSVE